METTQTIPPALLPASVSEAGRIRHDPDWVGIEQRTVEVENGAISAIGKAIRC